MSVKLATTLPLRLDPAYGDKSRQLHAALRQAILAGLLSPGARLASSRELARQLKIGRNIVVAAYEQLLNDGLISARQGSGSFIAESLPGAVRREVKSQLALAPDRPRPFVLGHSGGDPGLLSHLGRALSEAAKSAKLGDLAYGDPRGHPALREEIARFLAVSRGIAADPDQVFVMGGVQPALRLAAETLLMRGDRVWFEDPGYPAAAMTLKAAGLLLAPVPVDGEGLDVAVGRRRWAKARAAYVTPSHQFPLGVTLSMARRTALLEWAREQGAYLLEDDYDSEFRYDGPPLTALAGLDSERVIYIGTFTKTLFAGLRLAYLVAPPDVVAKLAKARATLDRFPASLPQIALARLMAEGNLARHVRRMRQVYGEARALLASTLSSEGEGLLQVIAPPQGLHLLALLPKAWPKGSAEEIRRAAGIAARLLSETRLTPRKGDGFILGFSGYEPKEIVAGAKALARATRLYAKAKGR